MDNIAIGKRLTELRKVLSMNKPDFAHSVGVSDGVINNIEYGRISNLLPKKPLLDLICTTYNVNPEWLYDGVGEMFLPQSRDKEIAAYVARVLDGKNGAFQKNLITVLSHTTVEEWEVLERFMREIVGGSKKEPEG